MRKATSSSNALGMICGVGFIAWPSLPIFRRAIPPGGDPDQQCDHQKGPVDDDEIRYVAQCPTPLFASGRIFETEDDPAVLRLSGRRIVRRDRQAGSVAYGVKPLRVDTQLGQLKDNSFRP